MTEKESTENKPAVKKAAKKKPATSKTKQQPSSSSSIAAWVAGLALVVGCIAVAASGYVWVMGQEQKADAFSQTVQREDKIYTQLDKQMSVIEALQRAQIQSTRQYSQTRQHLEELTETLGRDRHEWLLAEIRYTLRLANMRLQLFKDKDSALLALNAADEQIAGLADPSLHNVRALLSKEIAALRAVTDIDVEGISLAITALSDQVMALSIRIPERSKVVATEPTTQTQELEAWQQHAGAIWDKMKTLVTIRRSDKKVTPLLTPDESHLIRQNLRLKLELARVSLLQRDTGMFHNSLLDSRDWIAAYFNADRDDVKAVINKLDELSALEINPTYPSIAGSLSELDIVINKKKKTSAHKDNPPEAAVQIIDEGTAQ